MYFRLFSGEASNLETPVHPSLQDKTQRKACSHFPKGASQQDRKLLENNHSSLAKYHRTKLCPPNPTFTIRGQVGYLDLHPCWAIMRYHNPSSRLASEKAQMGTEAFIVPTEDESEFPGNVHQNCY